VNQQRRLISIAKGNRVFFLYSTRAISQFH
jgi:hypothetical protein